MKYIGCFFIVVFLLNFSSSAQHDSIVIKESNVSNWMVQSFDSIYESVYKLIKSGSNDVLFLKNSQLFVELNDTFITGVIKSNNGEILKKCLLDKYSIKFTLRNSFNYTEPDLSDIKSVSIAVVFPGSNEPVFLADLPFKLVGNIFNSSNLKQISRVHNYKMRNSDNIRIRYISIDRNDFHEYGKFIPFSLFVGLRNSLSNKHIRPKGYNDSVCSVFEDIWNLNRKENNCSIPDIQMGVIILIKEKSRNYPSLILPVIYTYFCDEKEYYYCEGSVEFSVFHRQFNSDYVETILEYINSY